MQFIDWAINEFLKNPYQLLDEAQQAQSDFYNRNVHDLANRLKEKLERGKREHGDTPTYTPEQLNNEMEEELLDILGYLLVDRWLNK
jgi:hypothetical protein